MARMILLIAVGIFAWLALQKFKSSAPAERRKLLFQWVLISLALIAVLLAITGRLHWIGAAIAVVLPVVGRLWRTFGRHLPLIAPLLAKRAQAKQAEAEARKRAQNENQDQTQRQSPQSPQLTEQEACQILNVSRDAGRDEIIGAHRKLIQKFHPDRGGNDYLAVRINAAKELLMKQFE